MACDETFNSLTSEKTDHSIVGSFEGILLSEVRKSKSLYCSHNPDYNNMAKNRLVWLMIAEKCKRTVAECVKRWHSLLRIYFSSSPEISWTHIQEFKKFEPYLSNHNLQSPSTVQKNQLLRELWFNRNDLKNPESTPEERQNVWLKIISKCNAITPGVIMSNKNWQKYWLIVKQNFGARLYTTKPSHYENSSNMAETYTEEELQIIDICNTTPRDPVSKIITAMGSNFELGTDKKSLMTKCKKCLQQKNEILFYGCCSNCCEKPIFCKICDFGGELVKYKLINWSKEALELLPIKVVSNKEISLCYKCSDELNRKATIRWKICRLCEANKTTNLDYLYCKTNDQLRKSFKDAIKYEFKEEDGLPGYICKMCKSQLTQLNEFVKKFKRTQNKLMQIHFRNFIGDLLNELEEQKVQNNSGPVMKLYKNLKSDIYKPAVKSKKASAEKKVLKKDPIGNEVVPVAIIPSIPKAESFEVIPTLKSESIEIPDTPVNFAPQVPPEIAIKDVFSLKRSNLQKRIQSSTVTVSLPESGKVSSNKILNSTIAVSQPLLSSPKLNDNTSAAVSTEVKIFPTKTLKTTSSPEIAMGKPQKVISMLPRSGPNKIINLKPTAASKPAIFTIPIDKPPTVSEPAVSHIVTDYETIEDAPPVFCIPKNLIKTNNATSDADKKLMSLTPNSSPIIKIEQTHDDDFNPCADTPIEKSNIPLVESTQISEAPPKESSSLEPKNNTKVVRIRGQLVAVKPHPYLLGAFVPVEYNEEQQIPGTGARIRPKLQIIRKVNSDKNIVHIEKPTFSQSTTINQSKIATQREQRAIKKPRKYWGTVDEFPLPVKTKTAVAAPVNIFQKPKQKLYLKLLDKSADSASSLPNPLEVQIKKEIPYSDDTSDAVASYQNQYSDSNTSKNRSFRTSFKLKKLRVNLKRDKRVHKMALKSKKLCLMQTVKENNLVQLVPHAISVKYETADCGFI